MDKSDGFSWRVDQKPGRIGSGHLETRLRESLDFLSTRFGVSVPKRGRHRAALEILERWNEADVAIDLSDQEELRRITEAHRLAWETFLITVAAVEDRRNHRTPFTPEKLSLMLGGDVVVEGRRGTHRDTQFELFLAAMLRLPGLSVTRGEPDLRLIYGKEDVGVAVKRIRSLNVDQVQKRAREGAEQIEREGLRGWIALNLDSRFAVVDYAQDEGSLLADFSKAFDSVNAALRRPAMKRHVLGFILLGYVYSWHPPETGTTEPRLHWAAPLRWQGLTEMPAEVALFQEFTNRWADRWAVRLRTISSKDFVGLL